MVQKYSPLVSVVLATKNEEENIENCLRSIKKQTYPDIEIIVVDFNSTDKTRMIARKYTTRIFQLNKVMDLKKTKNFRGAQINLGVKKSKGTLVFFPDADMTFDKDLIQESVDLIGKYRYSAVYIPEVIVGNGIFGRIRNFERSFYNMTCIDVVRIVKKDIFLRIGGFDEEHIQFGPDDWDFMKKLKKKHPQLTITKNKIYHHEERLPIKTYLTKKLKYSTTFNSYSDKWGKDDQDVKKQLGFYYRFFGVFTEQGKWKKLLRHPLLTIGMYFLRMLVGLGHLKSFRLYAKINK